MKSEKKEKQKKKINKNIYIDKEKQEKAYGSPIFKARTYNI